MGFDGGPSPNRRIVLLGACAAAVAPAVSPSAVSAATFPSRPLRLLVGFGAGGPTDILARVLARGLGDIFGQQVAVENRAGASGNIATQAVATAVPDGSTLLVGASPLVINQIMVPGFPIKLGRDLLAVAPLGTTENVLVVHPSLGVGDLAGFVRFVRQHPSTVTYATLGAGTFSHLAAKAFDVRAGTSMVAVAYRGAADAATDVLSGRVKVRFGSIPAVLPQIRAGTLLALATTGPRRTPWLPDVPTIAESGYPGFDVRLWVGVFAPAGVSEDRLQTIEAAVDKAAASDTMRKAMDVQGIAPLTMSRAEFARFVAAEIERWTPVAASLKD